MRRVSFSANMIESLNACDRRAVNTAYRSGPMPTQRFSPVGFPSVTSATMTRTMVMRYSLAETQLSRKVVGRSLPESHRRVSSTLVNP